MARVSRKAAIQKKKGQDGLPKRIYQTAVYIRLSVEDPHPAGESIQMQRYILEQYVAVQPDMQLYGVFCDNGESGTDFNRPSFLYMMEQVHQGKVDCIVVKDLSRFGRNYIEVGYYLEKIFPCLGVRFVAVYDQYDTLELKNKDELVYSLKNLMNDWYAKDISKKIGSAFFIKQKNGEFIGATAPYGYLKSQEDRHKLVVDMQTAPIVQKIFQWRIEGQGWTQIACRLNQRKIPSPSFYHYQKGHRKKKPSKAGSLWQAQGVKALVQNPVYAGHMVQGKYKTSLSDGILKTAVKRENWIVVKHTHPAIISQEIFDQVQKNIKQHH